jgi:hypothetical protein
MQNTVKHKIGIKNNKQGPCGSFCFKYWLGGGCEDNCTQIITLCKAKLKK